MPGMTRRNFILGSLGVIGTLGVSGCGTGNAESTTDQAADVPADGAAESAPIMLPSVMSLIYDNTFYTLAYSYDEAGNLTGKTDTRVRSSGGVFISDSGQIEAYDAGANYALVDTYTLDERGLPTALDRSVVNDGSESNHHFTFEVSTDDQGRWTQVASMSDSGACVATFEYEGDRLCKITQDHGHGELSTEFDEHGWDADLSSDSAEYDAEGRLVKHEDYTGLREFQYDSEGNLTMLTVDGEPEATISYVTIEKPSAAARAFSNLKFDFGLKYPYSWYWEPDEFI